MEGELSAEQVSSVLQQLQQMEEAAKGAVAGRGKRKEGRQSAGKKMTSAKEGEKMRGKRGTAGGRGKGGEAAGHTMDYFKSMWGGEAMGVSGIGNSSSMGSGSGGGSEWLKGMGAEVAMAAKLAEALEVTEGGEEGVSAAGEKEKGNTLFKAGDYRGAIGCYSASIALQPTAVAYANRAMAQLKLNNFAAAESDCTEALLLDDEYVKALARRGTARVRMNRSQDAVKDFEAALRLEPENKELQRQLKEAKKKRGESVAVPAGEDKAAPAAADERRGQGGGKSGEKIREVGVEADRSAVQEGGEEKQRERGVTAADVQAAERSERGDGRVAESEREGKEAMREEVGVPPHLREQQQQQRQHRSPQKSLTDRKARQPTGATAAAVGGGAAAGGGGGGAVGDERRVTAAAARLQEQLSKNLPVPTTAYRFEAAWRSLKGSPAGQAELLKQMDPSKLPAIFKDCLTPALLKDIVTVALSPSMLDHAAEASGQLLLALPSVPRFKMATMCFTLEDRRALGQLWDDATRSCNALVASKLANVRKAYGV